MGRIVYSPIAGHRLDRARSWLKERSVSAPLLVIAPSAHAGNAILRAWTKQAGALFGPSTSTLGQLAGRLAAPALAEQERVAVDGLALSAVCARVIDALRARGELGALTPIADRPSLQRALSDTLRELSMAMLKPEDIEGAAPSLGRILRAYQRELDTQRLADRAWVYARAIEVLEHGRWPARPLLWLDQPITNEAERRLCAALMQRAKPVLATVASGDLTTRDALVTLLGEEPEEADLRALWDADLSRLQHHVFQVDAPHAQRDSDSVELFSAPGEGREAIEIARRILEAAAGGTPFDRIAVLLRAPERYRVQLAEAFARADIPACFSMGTRVPDPSGRALLALLRCKAEHLSADRFAEYLSLGVTADANDAGAPHAALDPSARWVPADSELTRSAAPAEGEAPSDPEAEQAKVTEESAVRDGTLRAPFRWERMLVDAAVIGGRERWQRRLDGLAKTLELSQSPHQQDAATEAQHARDLQDLRSLRAFALPLIEAIDALPESASWGEWIDRLSALATRAVRDPEHVISTLHELSPMASVGGVSLLEVELLLRTRLTDLSVRTVTETAGRVYVASVEEARGLRFDLVFVPGLAEKMFPQKVREDPLLLDAQRRELSDRLTTNVDRVARERLALRIAVGAADRRLVLSFARVDTDKGRPRVPSFYGLEAMRAVTGVLPSFDSLMRDAEHAGQARMGMPAPRDPLRAIDAAELDLSLLQQLIAAPADASTGAAHYLLKANQHLARSLRARARRWTLSRFTGADGLLELGEAGIAALQRHQLDARAYSPSALQTYAACPYRFALRGVVGLIPREVPEAIETLDPRTRGTMIHRAQYACLVRLRAASLLPVTTADLVQAGALLDQALDAVVVQMQEELAPAIARVWQDGVTSVRADLHAWLSELAQNDWTPERFELGFGVSLDAGMDPQSQREAVTLDNGLRVRGAIDLVERHGERLRACDHKTGKVTTRPSVTINGGLTLQPLLYAMALEKLFPDATVAGGRLYYCTVKAGFASHMVPLDDTTRASVTAFVQTLDEALRTPFLPAAPDHEACEHCDYVPVCGPFEELRLRQKDPRRLRVLQQLRGLP